jgi:hypothetical protein
MVGILGCDRDRKPNLSRLPIDRDQRLIAAINERDCLAVGGPRRSPSASAISEEHRFVARQILAEQTILRRPGERLTARSPDRCSRGTIQTPRNAIDRVQDVDPGIDVRRLPAPLEQENGERQHDPEPPADPQST